MVLLDSTYQIEWLLVGVVVVLRGPADACGNRSWPSPRCPCSWSGTWYVKDTVLFGTTTTSSWLGMNLARIGAVQGASGHHRTPRTPGHAQPVSPRCRPSARQRLRPEVRASDAPRPIRLSARCIKADGATNFNNPIYITVSSQYLHDDLAYIAAHPREYLGDLECADPGVARPERSELRQLADWPAVRGYATVYDRIVEWQPVTDPAADQVVFEPTRPSPLSWLSLQAVAVYLPRALGHRSC